MRLGIGLAEYKSFIHKLQLDIKDAYFLKEQ